MTVFQKMNSTVQGTWNDLYEANDPPNQQNLWDFEFELDPRIINLSRGVLPETLRRGPYAVVDERCDETTLLYKEGLLF